MCKNFEKRAQCFFVVFLVVEGAVEYIWGRRSRPRGPKAPTHPISDGGGVCITWLSVWGFCGGCGAELWDRVGGRVGAIIGARVGGRVGARVGV